MALMTAVLTAYEKLKPMTEAFKIFCIAAALYVIFWMIEMCWKAVFVVPAQIHREQKESIEQSAAAAAIKLSIEGVRCQWEFSKCTCCATVRNLSKTSSADNVSVRVDGKLTAQVGYAPGFNPFHISDLTPHSGLRSINPDSAADFIFPDAVSELVFVLGFQTPQSGKKREPQIIVLTASSSTSPTVREEFLIVEKDWQQVAVIKNITFTTNPA